MFVIFKTSNKDFVSTKITANNLFNQKLIFDPFRINTNTTSQNQPQFTKFEYPRFHSTTITSHNNNNIIKS